MQKIKNGGYDKMKKNITIFGNSHVICESLCRALEEDHDFGEVQLFLNPIVFYEKLKASEISGVLILEFPFLNSADVFHWDNLLTVLSANLEVIFLTSHIRPYTQKIIYESDHSFLDSKQKLEQIIEELKALETTPKKLKKTEVKEERIFLLTRTEIELLKLLSLGQTQAEIAKKMNISLRTVNNHVSNIYEKLEVKNNVAAVMKGVLSGVICI